MNKRKAIIMTVAIIIIIAVFVIFALPKILSLQNKRPGLKDLKPLTDEEKVEVAKEVANLQPITEKEKSKIINQLKVNKGN